MTLAFVRYDRQHYAVQYTLANQTDVLAYLVGLYGASAYLSGNTIINPVAALNPTDWIVVTENTAFMRESDAMFQQWYDLATDQTGLGVATVPSLTAGSSTTISVPLKPNMGDTNYTAVAWLIGSVTLLGQLTVTATTVVDASHVNVTVQNGALVTVTGGKVVVGTVHN